MSLSKCPPEKAALDVRCKDHTIHTSKPEKKINLKMRSLIDTQAGILVSTKDFQRGF